MGADRLDVRRQRHRLPGSGQHLDCRWFHPKRVRFGQHPAGLMVFSRSFVLEVCPVPGPGRASCRSVRSAQNPHHRDRLVGGFHRPGHRGAAGDSRRAGRAAGSAVSTRRWRGDGLPRFQPPGGGLDSLSRTRARQRLDFRGRRRRRGHHAAADHLRPGPLRLALLVLDLRGHRAGGRVHLVPHRARPARGAPLGPSGGSGSTFVPACPRRPRIPVRLCLGR